MNSPEKALEVYSKLKEANRIDIEIERNGATDPQDLQRPLTHDRSACPSIDDRRPRPASPALPQPGAGHLARPGPSRRPPRSPHAHPGAPASAGPVQAPGRQTLTVDAAGR